MGELDIHDELIAAVLAVALRYGKVVREDVVRWADKEIEVRTAPPVWLIDLSMSARLHVLDLLGLLNSVAGDTAGVAVARGIYSLVRDTSSLGFDECGTLATELYRITYDCLNGDWSQSLLTEADRVHDNFAWVRDGYSKLSRGEVMQQFDEFLGKYRSRAFAERLQPITYSVRTGVADY